MKLITRLGALISGLMGLGSLVFVGYLAILFPDRMARISIEPEDVSSFIFYIVLLVTFALIMFTVMTTLWFESVDPTRFKFLMPFLIVFEILLLALAAMSFFSDMRSDSVIVLPFAIAIALNLGLLIRAWRRESKKLTTASIPPPN